MSHENEAAAAARTRRRSCGAPLATVLVVMALTACTPHSSPTIRATDAPLDDFRELQAGVRVLDQLEIAPTRACLIAAGIDLPPENAELTPAVPQDARIVETPTELRPSDVTPTGYPDAPVSEPSGWSTLESEVPETQFDAYEIALRGSGDAITTAEVDGVSYEVGATGCLAEARTEVYGDLTDYLYLQFFPKGAQLALADLAGSSAIAEVMQKWSACMSVSGFDLATPTDAFAAVQAMGAEQISDGTAHELAMADAECRSSVRLHQTYDETAEGLAASWVREHATEVAAANARVRDLIARAEDRTT